MKNYFDTKIGNLTSFGPQTWGGDFDMILVRPDGPTLPTEKGSFVMLHEKHSNHSLPMVWDEKSSSFTCQHCKRKVNLSEKLFNDIVELLSKDAYGVVSDTQAKVTIAYVLEEFPPKGTYPGTGCFVVKRVIPD